MRNGLSKTLVVNNSNISLLFPPDTFMVITFSGALRQALAYCVHLNIELFSCADGTLLLLRDTKHRRAALDSHGSTVSCCFHQRSNFFSSLIDGCLKYKNKEKPKTGPRPGPRLNYDVKIGPKPSPRGVKKSGSVRPGLKCRALKTVTFWKYSRGLAEGVLYIYIYIYMYIYIFSLVSCSYVGINT